MAYKDIRDVEELLAQLGKTGKYQRRQHLLHFLAAVLAGMHMFSLTFIAPTPRHRCFIPEVDQDSSEFTINSNSTSATFDTEVLANFIPLNQNGELDSCRRYNNNYSDNNGVPQSFPLADNRSVVVDKEAVKSCHGQFVYDTSIYQQSRVYDWDMVCENKWKRAFIQSIYVLGVFSGALFSGSLADRYGRKVVLCVSGLLQFSIAISQPYFTSYALYCGALFFYGMFGSAGAFITAYVCTMELVHKTRRATIGAIFNSSFAVGASLVAVYGYFIRDIKTLQTTFALHASVFCVYPWLLDESIRWLWSQGRVEEAVKVVTKAVKINGGAITSTYELGRNNDPSLKPPQKQQPTITTRATYGLVDLFRFPIMRRRAIITAFNWFALSLCFYGLAFNTGRLPGNPYLVFFICALADLPGFLLVTLLVSRTGRRGLHVAMLLLGGLAAIGTTVIPRGLLVTTIALLSKVCLAMCYTLIYNYTVELFPTVVRNSALGLCMMFARLGGILTPQITLLNSFDQSIPSYFFGGIAIVAALSALSLPETLDKDLPQTMEEGESYGKDDDTTTGFGCCKKKPRTKDDDDGFEKRNYVSKAKKTAAACEQKMLP